MVRLPIGTSDFAQLRHDGYHFVDKSGFIIEIIRSPARVVSLPRPRRFGKTLNLSMLRYWLDRDADAGLFDGLEADGKVRVLVSSAERANSYGYLPIPLTAFREVTSAGAVGAIAAIGGVLASDTTPVLGAAATSEAMQIVWAAGNADIIQASISLPGDFSGAFDVLLELQVLTDNAGGGGIEAATFTVNSSWDNGAQVVDTATDGTPAVTVHKVTATIAAADVADAPSFVNIQLVPGTHANDPIHLLSARLVFRRAST